MQVQVKGKAGIETTFRLKHQTCQERIDRDIETKKYEWLQLTHVLQNIQGKDPTTIIGKELREKKNVILKVQTADKAKHEYDVQRMLSDIDGFIDFTCYFSCKGDSEYIRKFTKGRPVQPLCSEKGNSMGIIMMPYYRFESFEKFLREYPNKYLNHKIDIINNVLEIIYHAYTEKGFTHGDLFSKNILLDDKLKPILIDFENSQFYDNIKVIQFYRDIDHLIGDATRYLPAFKDKLTDISRRHVMMNMAFNKQPIPDIMNALRRGIYELQSI